jgi:hypothetical protein
MTDQPNHNLSQKLQTLADRMGEAAAAFLAALTPDQRRQAVLDFADEEARTFWHYTPIPRKGLPLNEMDFSQQRLALQLVAIGLSRTGYVAASTIMGLETTLDMIESWQRPLPGRDSRLYFLSFFGEPDSKGPWSWRFEGHHISLNYTLINGQIASPTPTFFGANPAEASFGSVGVLRPLGGSEDLARELVHALSAEQRQRAILSVTAPDDIITTNAAHLTKQEFVPPNMALELSRALSYSSSPKGLAGQQMQAAQQEILSNLLRHYISRMPDEIAEMETQKLQAASLGDIHFAWAGGLECGQPHYYRLQGPDLLVEYDNTQNNANHIHSVWRDPADDFGARLLAQHYAHNHRH